ncbi:ABC transporter substrate-binding protein [Rhodopila sp.]|jgi:branched-chain amino acid transport system substrate-binding protein|uniref:ABC transporter substrate-binding protein n=1 Tax=Rhodopila sp. TaxID=2480087 RepID=UPI002CF07C04|nr:ABC transporter substrate-binding protein [Rhodopila sp.]HVZ07143.1 ABC transporter substrate-binding protein [Rhodopila sp.]
MMLARRDLLALGTGTLVLGSGLRLALADDKVIVLGVSIPLSGPAAPTGITTQRTLEHAFELINAKGIMIGGDRYTIRPQFYDNKYIPAEAVAIVEKMLADNVHFLFSSGSGNSVPVVGKTTEAKVLQMSGASGKEHLTGPKFPYSFRVQPTNETAYAVYPWIKQTYPEVKRVAHMNPSDEAGYTESEDRRMISEKNGFTTVGNEYFKRGSTDMYPVATRLVALNPDMIDFGGTIGRDQGLAVKALRELGYKGKILLGYSDAKSFVDIAGADAAEGTILFDTLAEPQNAGQKELYDWWIKTYGPPFPSYAFLMWDWPFMFADALRKAQSTDPVKVAEAMRTITYHGIFGEERFGMKSVYGIDSSLTRDIPMSVIKGGKPVFLATVPWPAGV